VRTKVGRTVLAILLGLLTSCGYSEGDAGDRGSPPRQAPVTTGSSATVIPDAPTTCTGSPRDPAACIEGKEGRLPTSR
jgi:hypothetical protein